MPDPVTSLGIAANVVQFVDFGVNLLTKGREIRQRGSTRANDELEALTQDLAGLSQYLQTATFFQARGSAKLNDNEQVSAPFASDLRCQASVDVRS